MVRRPPTVAEVRHKYADYHTGKKDGEDEASKLGIGCVTHSVIFRNGSQNPISFADPSTNDQPCKGSVTPSVTR